MPSMRHDMDIYRKRMLQELVYGGEVQIPTPLRLRRVSENYVGDVLLLHHLGEFAGYIGALDL